MKASDLKNKGLKITLQGKEYTIKFNMNTFCELEEVYGDAQKAFEDMGKMKMKAIRALIYAGLKAEDETLTLEQVGEMLDLNNLTEIGKSLNGALEVAMPEATGDVEGE